MRTWLLETRIGLRVKGEPHTAFRAEGLRCQAACPCGLYTFNDSGLVNKLELRFVLPLNSQVCRVYAIAGGLWLMLIQNSQASRHRLREP